MKRKQQIPELVDMNNFLPDLAVDMITMHHIDHIMKIVEGESVETKKQI